MAAVLFLELSSPRGYIAFVSLFASHATVSSDQQADSFLKWTLCVAVMFSVDLAWLLIGVGLNRARLEPFAERVLNISLGAMIIAATLLIFLWT